MTTISYKDLIAQREALEQQIAAARKAEVDKAKAKIRQIVSEFSLTADDVFPAGRRQDSVKGSTIAPKYRDPATGSTWTGRGKAPLWIADKDRSQFEIKL